VDLQHPGGVPPQPFLVGVESQPGQMLGMAHIVDKP
jgi:hypothetical protein